MIHYKEQEEQCTHWMEEEETDAQQRLREGSLSGAHLYTLWCKQKLCDKTRVHLLTPLLVQKWCPKTQREHKVRESGLANTHAPARTGAHTCTNALAVEGGEAGEERQEARQSNACHCLLVASRGVVPTEGSEPARKDPSLSRW